MTKEQINYLLVLATLLIVWLYFNTFYVNAKKSYGVGPFGGVKSSTSALKFPSLPVIPKVPAPPTMADLGKTFSKGNQAPAASAEAVSIPVTLVPVSEAKK